MNFNQNYYAVIPAPVLNHPELSPSAKLFYAQVSALTNEHGFCWASNAYFAERNSVSEWTISSWISQLQRFGFVRVDIDKKAGNQRHIYLADAAPLLRKTQRGSLGKSHDPHGKNPTTLLGKTPTIISKENNYSDVVKVSAARAENDNSFPKPPVLFEESRWVAEKLQWGAAFAAAGGPEGADAEWYWQRCRTWSKTKGGRSADWPETGASFAREDEQKQKLKTVNQNQPEHGNAAKPDASIVDPNRTLARVRRLAGQL